MAATTSEKWSGFNGKPVRREGLAMRDTHWGFTVSEKGGAMDRAGLAETSLKSLAFLAATIGGVVPLIDTSMVEALPLVQRIGLSVGFVAVGVAVFFYALRGFRTELQVDTARKTLRIGSRNNAGGFHERRRLSVKEVESLFLQRERGRSARLALRVKGGIQPVRLFEGREAEMVTFLERITLAIRAEMGEKRRARTETRGRFTHVTFG